MIQSREALHHSASAAIVQPSLGFAGDHTCRIENDGLLDTKTPEVAKTVVPRRVLLPRKIDGAPRRSDEGVDFIAGRLPDFYFREVCFIQHLFENQQYSLRIEARDIR